MWFTGGFPAVTISETGQVAFLASLAGADVPGGPEGLFATDGNGTLHLVAIEGMELVEGTTVSKLWFGYPTNVYDYCSNMALAFNADGKLVFGARMVDGSYHVIAAVVPEPGSLILMVGAAIVLLTRRRRFRAWNRPRFAL